LWLALVWLGLEVLLPALLAAAALAQAPQAPRPAVPDSLFPPAGDVVRLYTDCDESRWPYGIEERFVPKTPEEIVQGVERRRALEAAWREWYRQRAGDSLPPTTFDRWAYPLAVRGRLLNNFANPREGSLHEALDIFVAEGTVVRSPVNGVVVAAGDNWRGGYTRRRGFYYEGDGLSRRAGNGGMIFDPASGEYVYLVHFQDSVLVRAGDVVRRGQPVGRVGHTGNAIYPGRGRHLHLAYKRPGTGCGVDGGLVAENPYRWLRTARARRGRS